MNADVETQNNQTLLRCLAFLTRHFGKPVSPSALIAGLAYDERGMGPALFCEAAARIGLKTRVTRRAAIGDIARAVLPVVLILRDDQACVLLSRKDGQAQVYMPETDAQKEVPLPDLEKDYAGYAIFVHPEAAIAPEEEQHETTANATHWFWGIVEENRSIYGMALLGSVFINLFALAAPLYIMNVYDRVIPNNAIETGWALGIGALLVFVFDFIMRNLRTYLIDLAGRRMDTIAGRRIYDQVLNMKLAHRPRSSGSFANMLRDFDAVRDFFTSATITVLVDLPFTLFFLFVIYQLGGGLAFILMGLIAAVFIIGLLIQAPLKAIVRKAAQSSETKHGLLVETIHGLETIKAMNADGKFRARYDRHLAENALYGQQSRFISGLGTSIATFLQQIASIIIVLAGMYMVKDGDLTTGGLIACVILGGRAITPIGQIANLMARYHQAGGALKTLEKVMAHPAERLHTRPALHRPHLDGNIAFEDVHFSYPATERKILNAVSFSIQKGEKVGIIGRVGSGKSTIARLMMKLYEPDGGTILIDGTDSRQIDVADMRRNMGYVPQDAVLFSGSVRENITAGVMAASDEEVLAVAKLAGVHDFIARHPMGYDAPVGEQGCILSGGQRQAIALARAILTQPNIMICDEPTNAMDTHTEDLFKQYVATRMKGKTLVLITHKHDLLPLVDRLILVDQGRVIMDGPRDEVIQALKKKPPQA